MTDSTTPAPDDFDSLLGTPPSAEETQALEELNDGGVPAETPEQARIRQLEAQLSALVEEKKNEKTPEQKQLEHSQALAATRIALEAPEKFEEADSEDVIHLHVLVSGITAFGRVWHSGQELTIPVGGDVYKGTKDRTGASWLDDLSPSAQIKRWGKPRFGVGPWPYEAIPQDELSAEDAARGTRVPITL